MEKVSMNKLEMARRAAKGGSGGTISPATSETLGGVKIGAGVNVSADGTISVPSYTPPAITTEEVNTGWKYRGKDIYLLNIHVNDGIALEANTQVSVTELANVDTLFDAKAYEGSGLAIPKSAVVENGVFKFEAFGSFTVHDFMIAYTKAGA